MMAILSRVAQQPAYKLNGNFLLLASVHYLNQVNRKQSIFKNNMQYSLSS